MQDVLFADCPGQGYNSMDGNGHMELEQRILFTRALPLAAASGEHLDQNIAEKLLCSYYHLPTCSLGSFTPAPAQALSEPDVFK